MQQSACTGCDHDEASIPLWLQIWHLAAPDCSHAISNHTHIQRTLAVPNHLYSFEHFPDKSWGPSRNFLAESPLGIMSLSSGNCLLCLFPLGSILIVSFASGNSFFYVFFLWDLGLWLLCVFLWDLCLTPPPPK